MAHRILIIDDDEDILDILRIIFQEEGYQVIISNTAQAADYIHSISPNLILLDIRLSGSGPGGVEICKEFKSSYPEDKIPVILVSAENNINLLAMSCGADGYLRKPFDIFDLLRRVKELIP